MQIVGYQLFLSTRLRPDISINETHNHLQLAIRLLIHIGNTKHLKFPFNGSFGLHFCVFVDSSNTFHTDRKSQYVVSIHLNINSLTCITLSKIANL